MIIKDPWYLTLLCFVPVITYFVFMKKPNPSWKFSTISIFKKNSHSLRIRLIFLPQLLQLIAIVLVVFSLARPQQGDERSRIVRQGIAITMVLDKSSSMSQKDFEYERTTVERFDAAKKAFKNFVVGNNDLKGRPHDLIGMISFARWADTHSPLTLDHQMIEDLLDQVETVTERSEDGTAIGEAIAAACEKLKRTDKFANPPRSKIIVLVTDGQETVSGRVKSAVSPSEATALAQSLGIKIYTIGLTPNLTQVSSDPFNLFRGGPEVDEKLLSDISKMTGGLYFRASDSKGFGDIMTAIDELEKSRIEDVRYTRYSERYLPFLLMAMALIACSYFLNHSYLRRGP